MFWNKYPYTDFHELNLDYVLAAIKLMRTELENFISFNQIKFADPIEWNISTQYAENTVVIDPNSNIAYISKNAVPAGIQITNTDYWLSIFDFSRFFNEIGNLDDLDTTAKDTIVNAINEIFAMVNNIPYVTPELFGAIGDGTTDDTAAFVEAIDSGLPVILSPKTYLIDTLNITGVSKQIRGCGANSIIKANNIIVSGSNFITFDHMTFIARSSVTDFITVESSYHVDFNSVGIGKENAGLTVDHGIYFDGTDHCYYCSVVNSDITEMDIGILLKNGNANFIQNNEFYQNNINIKIDSANGINIIGNHFQTYYQKGIDLDYTSGSPTTGNLIEGNYFEGDPGYICDIDMNNNATVKYNFIIGNKITYIGKPHISNAADANTVLDATHQTENIANMLPGYTSIPPKTDITTSNVARNIGAVIPYDTGLSGRNKLQVMTLGYDASNILQWCTVLHTRPGVDTQVSYYSQLLNKELFMQHIWAGPSSDRPTYEPRGMMYFDTTINKPIWLKDGATTWVDATGATV